MGVPADDRKLVLLRERNRTMKPSESLSGRNQAMRVEVIDILDEERQGDLVEFFRKLTALHVYWEYVVPTARQGKFLALAVVQDRPWPPWGLGASKVQALHYFYPLENGFAGVGGLFIRPHQVGNLGIVATLYKEALAELIRQGYPKIGYFIRDDGFLVHRVLQDAGFVRVDEELLSDDGRYTLHVADAEAVLRHLDLVNSSEQDLLNFRFSDRTVDTLTALYATLQLTLQAWIHAPEASEVRPSLAIMREGYEPGTPPF